MEIIYKLSDQTTVIGDKPITIEKGETLNLTLQANSGFKFDPIPLVTIRTSSFQFINTNFQIDTTGKNATISYQIPTNAASCTVKSSTVESTDPEPETVTVTNNLSNCTSSLNNGTVNKGEEITITLTANNGFSFSLSDLPTIDYETTDTPSTAFNIASDKLTASVTITPNDNFTINANAHEIKTFVNVTYNLANCFSSLTGESVEKGKEITVTVTANENAQFDENTPNVFYIEHGTAKTVNFTLDTEKKTGTLTFTPNYNFTLNAEANVIQPFTKNYGAINVYKVSLENLDAFSKQRFSKVVDETTGATQPVNLGVYVNRIKRIFANVPVNGTDNLKCGNYDTKIIVESPKTDILTIDFGNVVIPSHNNDNTDFESTVKIFIPFVGFVDVPNDYTGETLNLQIDINVVTGNGLYRLIYNGTLIQTGDCTPSQDVLYKTADMEFTKIGGEEWNEKRNMGLEPYLFVKWYESKNPNGRNNDFKKGNISSFTGFNSFDNVVIQPNANMLAREQEMILTTLLKGVYVE